MKFNDYQNSHNTSYLRFTIRLQNIGKCKQTTKNNLEKAPSPGNITSITSVSFRIHFRSHARHPLNNFANFGGLWTNFFFFFSDYRRRKLILILQIHFDYLLNLFFPRVSFVLFPCAFASLARTLRIRPRVKPLVTAWIIERLSITHGDCWRFILITDFVRLTYSRIWRCY